MTTVVVIGELFELSVISLRSLILHREFFYGVLLGLKFSREMNIES
jgi:hypothetical protein